MKSEEPRIGWAWPGMHWCRHHFGSYNLQGEDVGGYARDLAAVSRWLGHRQVSTTANIYLHETGEASAAARLVTNRPPLPPTHL